VNEQGFKDFDDLTWIGFFSARRARAPASSTALNGEINRAVELPEVKEKLSQNGLTHKHNSPADFRRLYPRRDPQVGESGEGFGREGGLSAGMIDKIVPSVESALADVRDGSTILVGGVRRRGRSGRSWSTR